MAASEESPRATPGQTAGEVLTARQPGVDYSRSWGFHQRLMESFKGSGASGGGNICHRFRRITRKRDGMRKNGKWGLREGPGETHWRLAHLVRDKRVADLGMKIEEVTRGCRMVRDPTGTFFMKPSL